MIKLVYKFINVIKVFVIIVFKRMGHSNLSSPEFQLLWFHRQRDVVLLLFVYWETKYSFFIFVNSKTTGRFIAKLVCFVSAKGVKL